VGLDTGRIGTGSLAALATSLGPDLSGLGRSARLRNAVVTTGLPALLAGLEQGITAIVATHDNALIELADRVLELKDGRLIGDSVAAA